jgi:hypothetical protein
MSSCKAVVFAGVICLAISSLSFALGVPESNVPNLNNDEIVDFDDFAILSGNWFQSGTGLQGDLDDNGKVDTDDVMIFCWYWLTEYSEYQQCEGMGTDLNADGIIAFEDMSILAQNWLMTGEGLSGDFDTSNLVDYNDLMVLTYCWLKGTRPMGIWEQFKAALAAGDINTALTFILQDSQSRYLEIFQAIESNLPDFAAGMGALTLESQDEGRAVYEMTHQDGDITYLFPVVFIKDDDENWKIYNF